MGLHNVSVCGDYGVHGIFLGTWKLHILPAVSWKVFVPSLVLAAHFGFNGCGKPCLDRTLQGVPSAGSSAPL